MTNTQISFTEKIAEMVLPQIRERRNRLEREANTDFLTGLANRAAFDKARRTAEMNRSAFIVFDLNNFGLVNKTIGHIPGDQVLKNYAAVIETVATKYKARAFRLGGDEFVIICPRFFAAVIRDAVERRSPVRKFDDFTVSISGETGSSLEDADSRLQERKRLHKAK